MSIFAKKSMLKSMTGYGRTSFDMPYQVVNIEIKSLNSKQLDLNTRIPMLFREKEPEIRSLIAQQLERGKVDLFISIEQAGAAAPEINRELALSYAEQLKGLRDVIGQETEPDYLSLLLRFPEVFGKPQEAMDDIIWDRLRQGIAACLEKVDTFRVQEGSMIEGDLLSGVGRIGKLLSEVDTFEGERIAQRRTRLEDAVKEVAGLTRNDPARFEQEMIYYLERLDFSEEKSRLRQHCIYFIETLRGEHSAGRKLGFIAQEMGREINTLGSKAYHADIQKLVVQMKDELEKIKEQLGNVL